MKAVVMAGGQGTRLRPLTSNQPKPMLPIVGKPMMQHILALARRHGITEVVATVQFLASVIRNYFGDGSDLGISLSYVTEQEPLGTAGSVKNAEALLDDRFLVLSGDSLTDVDLTELIGFHEKNGAALTVTLKRAENPLDFGIVITDEEGRVERFLEKPGWGEVFSDTINTGIYVVEREILDHIPAGQEFDFSHDLFPLLLDKGLPLFGYVTDRHWTDVGNLEAYLGAHWEALERQVEVEIDGFEVSDGVWLGTGAELSPDAHVVGPAYIGENSRVEGGAQILDHTVLGRNVVVNPGATLQRSIVHDGAYLGGNSSLRGCVLGKNSDVKAGARLEEGVVVADECYVGEGALINPHVKVYPFKVVDPGAIVSESIVWQSGGARSLFGERGVAGVMNVDVTPEMALRLAVAYGGLLPKRSVIAACRDASRTARIVKRAMVAGANSSGIDCNDLELVPIPVARFYARSTRALGGFAVRSSAADASSVEIQFFDERGTDLDPETERRLERAYYRDDLRRAFQFDIGELSFPARGREFYVRGVLDSLDAALIRAGAPKLVVDYAYGAASVTGPQILGRLGAEVLSSNGVIDEDRAVLTGEELDAHAAHLARLVRSSGAEVGALIDAVGEKLCLVDGVGRVLSPQEQILAFVGLVSAAEPGARIALPVSTSRAADAIVRAGGGEVVWTRTSSVALMQAADEEDVVFAASEDGVIFPRFMPAFDAVVSLANLLELTARLHRSLESVVDELPQTHVVRRDVPTPWEAKGTVMRHVIEWAQEQGGDIMTIDGVKLFRGDDWVLVVPHAEEPLVRVWAEAGSQSGAEALVAETAAIVEEAKGRFGGERARRRE
jgi:mannose-1-phosphate guanylyltransferase/phosphomannomutase